MERAYSFFLLVVVLQLYFLDTCISKNISTDQSALLAVKASFTLNSSHPLTQNWSSQASVCHWIGVTCASRHRRVRALNISNMDIVGTIPPHLGNLSFLVSLDVSRNHLHSEIPKDIGNLRNLKELVLVSNQLTGSIPFSIFNISSLETLSLTYNQLSGSLPADICHRLRRIKSISIISNQLSGHIPIGLSNCTDLYDLSLSYNHFDRTIPPEIVNLERLERLNLGGNHLQGTIPAKIGNLQNLQQLQLENNQIVGSIPRTISNLSLLWILNLNTNNLTGVIPREIGNLHKLESLYLQFNNFGGVIPSSISNFSSLGDLRQLEDLNLGENNLTGVIPKELFNISTLRVIVLEFNNLSGNLASASGYWPTNLEVLSLVANNIGGVIPSSISNSSNLKKLYLADNKLSGKIPNSLGDLRQLEDLNLGGNNLTGVMPKEVFSISTLRDMNLGFNNLSASLPSAPGYWPTNVEHLYLGANNIGGVIPSSISNSSNLKKLDLSNNKLSGKIPNSLGDLRQLEELKLFNNNLWSPHLSILTSLVNCRSLRGIALGDNPLNGVLPDSIGNLSTSLEQFDLYRSEIRGQIPLGIGNLSNLIMLKLFSNELTGSVPTTFCDLQNLQGVWLTNNRLSGPLPECLCRLPKLAEVYLPYNQISGPIPYCIGNITPLREISLSSNRLTNIPMSLWSLKDLLELDLSNNSLVGSLPPDFGTLNHIWFIDLSRNHLSGSIPTTVGDLQSLVYLSLAYNELQGSIPKSLGKMINLESADLSNNILSGTIPKSLESLRYLKDFNVSFNRLEGEIPSKGPFLNFTSFMGNGELCGDLLFRPCMTRPFHQSRRSKLLLIILVPLGASLMVLASIVVFMLRRRGNRNVPTQAESLPARTTLARVSYIEVERATQGFDQCNLLGFGGYGSVYKGIFADGMVLAIKVFNLQIEGAFKSFDSECEVLRNLCHRNLTKVITSCTNLDFKALLLEYMPNGSLEQWLHSDGYFLNMIQRLDIMIDVASALEYLHHGYATVVVHGDLKPSNVLLDERLIGHVSDFGLAKLLGEGESIAHTRTLATMGYIAPEYGSVGLVSRRCDVYSYGIMLMETFTRRRPYDEMFHENLSMRSWVCNSLTVAPDNIVDVTLWEPEETDFEKKLHCVCSILELALNCTVESPNERLNMKDILANIMKIKSEFLRK